jgi:hypothetical protein
VSVKILSRISVTGINLCVCLSVELVGPRSTSSTITSFFIRQGHTGRCYGIYCTATGESIKRRARYKALNGNRTLRFFRDTRPNLSLAG